MSEQTATPEHAHASGEKCDMCDAIPVAFAGYAGGALTFEDFDQYTAAAEVQAAVEGEMGVFDMLLSNIRNAPDLDARRKAAAIVAAATQLDERLAAAAARERAEEQGDEAALRDATTSDMGSVSLFKDTDGRWRWISIHSNRYEDRERDIFTAEAHKAFVEDCYKSGTFPTLRLWHVPYDVGLADFVDYDADNGFVVGSGTFNDGMEDIAERLLQEKDLGCSHGYLFDRNDYRDGVYHAYRSYEISVLPRDKAANLLTAFYAGQEVPMLTPERKAYLERVAGPERVQTIERGLESLKGIADRNGIAYKSIEEQILDGRATKEEAVSDEQTQEQERPGNPDGAEQEREPEQPAEGGDGDNAEEGEGEGTGAAPAATPDEREEADKALGAAEPLLAQAALLDGLKSIMADAVAPIVTRLDQQDAAIAALQGSKDAEMAEMIRPKVGHPQGAAPQSAADDNVISEADAKVFREAAGKSEDGEYAPVLPYIQDVFNGRKPAGTYTP